jgi:hypothetical protein
VSWIKRTGDTMDLLTTDRLVFSADARYSLRDSALYLCQVNTHPPAFITVKLIVIGRIQ